MVIASKKIKALINSSHLNRSIYKQRFDAMTDNLNVDEVVSICTDAIDSLLFRVDTDSVKSTLIETKLAIEILCEDTEDTMDTVRRIANLLSGHGNYDNTLEKIQLYHVSGPLVLNASDYGVPQNRQRVVFIGCRNDQELITSIPATVKEPEKVTVAEAIGDLNYSHFVITPFYFPYTPRRYSR